jgi:hypothetical protein
MLTRLDHVLEHYRILSTSEAATRTLGSSERLALWLGEEVCPLAEELFQRADFRRLARWPIDNLAADAPTEARRLVDAIDRELVQSGRRLAELSSQLPGANVTPTETACPPSVSHRPADSQAASEADYSSIAEFVARRPWHDLVAIRDYFGPVSDLNLVDRSAWLGPDSALVQIGEFSPYSHPHWRLPGDHVSRATMTRVDYWLRHLRRFVIRFEEQHNRGTPQANELAAELRAAVASVYPLRDQLEVVCVNSDDSATRRSAITLVQAYAAFRPANPLTWLGPAASARSLASEMRYRLEKRNEHDIAAVTAAALQQLSVLYRQDVDPDDRIAEQVQVVDLVIIAGVGRREVYWKAKLIESDWFKQDRAWRLFANLAERAKQGLGVDDWVELKISKKDAKADLGKILPADLMSKITRNQDVFKLDIPADQIYIGHFEQRDLLTEIGASSPLITPCGQASKTVLPPAVPPG